ncbi:MAG TPA: hypothetical protein VLT33_03960 [Labilithrix sp.]|nr:hypothetical protein [Labilithrix sp.]
MKTTPDPNDALLAELRALPTHSGDPAFQARAQREARSAYLRSFGGGAGWSGAATSKVGRALVPVFLAMIVGLYMTWAIASATALVQ